MVYPLPKFCKYMYIEQISTNCLAEASYYVESDGEALVIDPVRESAPYLEKAAEVRAAIKHVLETHFHADFVSGQRSWRIRPVRKSCSVPGALTGFKRPHCPPRRRICVGARSKSRRVAHTPGPHAGKSSCYLLLDEERQRTRHFYGRHLVYRGCRPVLHSAVESDTSPINDLAGVLWTIRSVPESDRPCLTTLLTVYPGHGAGSACGKNISSETW